MCVPTPTFSIRPNLLFRSVVRTTLQPLPYHHAHGRTILAVSFVAVDGQIWEVDRSLERMTYLPAVVKVEQEVCLYCVP